MPKLNEENGVRKLSNLFLGVLLFAGSLPAWADLINEDVREAQERLFSNPQIYDRVDQYCKGKNPESACEISGTVWEGGGKGVCVNRYSQTEKSIDLFCKRADEIRIFRGTTDGSNADRFCRGKKVGSVCTAEFIYQGDEMHADGKCVENFVRKSPYERERYGGHQYATHREIRCEPPAVARTYTPASWTKKLFQ